MLMPLPVVVAANFLESDNRRLAVGRTDGLLIVTENVFGKIMVVNSRLLQSTHAVPQKIQQFSANPVGRIFGR